MSLRRVSELGFIRVGPAFHHGFDQRASSLPRKRPPNRPNSIMNTNILPTQTATIHQPVVPIMEAFGEDADVRIDQPERDHHGDETKQPAHGTGQLISTPRLMTATTVTTIRPCQKRFWRSARVEQLCHRLLANCAMIALRPCPIRTRP